MMMDKSISKSYHRELHTNNSQMFN